MAVPTITSVAAETEKWKFIASSMNQNWSTIMVQTDTEWTTARTKVRVWPKNDSPSEKCLRTNAILGTGTYRTIRSTLERKKNRKIITPAELASMNHAARFMSITVCSA